MNTESIRQTATGLPAAPVARKRLDPTQLFAQRDRLPWLWFLVAVAVTVFAAFDRFHLVRQFKQRHRLRNGDARCSGGAGIIQRQQHDFVTLRAF